MCKDGDSVGADWPMDLVSKGWESGAAVGMLFVLYTVCVGSVKDTCGRDSPADWWAENLAGDTSVVAKVGMSDVVASRGLSVGLSAKVDFES